MGYTPSITSPICSEVVSWALHEVCRTGTRRRIFYNPVRQMWTTSAAKGNGPLRDYPGYELYATITWAPTLNVAIYRPEKKIVNVPV